MASAIAEMTDAELGESPAMLPGPLATVQDAEDVPLGPLAWKPKGNWNWRGRHPAELGADPAGRPILTVSIQTNRPPALGELARIAEDADDQARADALARLQATPEWTTYIEAKGELSSVKHRLDALQQEAKALDEEHLRLASKPKGQGKRLAEIQARQGEISKDKHAAGLEMQALQPILADARRKAHELADMLATETVARTRKEQQQALDAVLADFCRQHSDELSDIAARVFARGKHAHEAQVAVLLSFIISRLETANPLPESNK